MLYGFETAAVHKPTIDVWCSGPGRDILEQNPSILNREGFPKAANSDSHYLLEMEASRYGQIFI